MDQFKDKIIRLITPKRALLDVNSLLSKEAMLHFSIGSFFAAFLTFSVHYCTNMFTAGIIFSLIICNYAIIKYTQTINYKNAKTLPSLSNISFINSHFITEDADIKCCGSKSQFCGWVFGVGTYKGLREKNYIKQEMHACIKPPFLILSIPNPRVDRTILSNKAHLSRDMFEYRRIINLRLARIQLYPAIGNIWGLKYPIGIYFNDSKEGKRANSVETLSQLGWTNWKKKSYERQEGVNLTSSIFQCQTRQSTLKYLHKSYRHPEKIYLCFITCPEKEMWFRNIQYAAQMKPVNPSLWQMIEPLIKRKRQRKTKKRKSPSTAYGEFIKYFAQFMPNDWIMYRQKHVTLDVEPIKCAPHMLWINAMFARVMWDLIEQNSLHDFIMSKFHKKIKKMQRPIYIEEIDIASLKIGHDAPIITDVDRPILDTWGLWMDIDFVYNGGISFTLETKVDLMKLRDQRESTRSQETGMQDTHLQSAPSISLKSSSEEKRSYRTARLESATFKSLSFRKKALNLQKKSIRSGSIYTSPTNLNNSHAYLTRRKTSLSNNANKIFTGKKFNINIMRGSFMNRQESSASKVSDFDFDEDDSDGLVSHEEASTKENFLTSPHRIILRKISSVIKRLKPHKKPPFKSQNILFRTLDKIGSSKYFQKATESKFVKRGLELFANQRIMLDVKLHQFSGTLTLHYPRPPTDRIWFGMRPDLVFKLTALPKIGERKLNFNLMIDWLQKKMKSELSKVLVLPNMENIRLPD